MDMEGTGIYSCRQFGNQEAMKVVNQEKGFTLVELLVTMVVFVLILTATSNTFIDLLKDFKKQSSQSETNIEGAVGLETLRRDIESAGYGLPWAVTGDVTTWAGITGYTEGANSGTPNPSTYNDGGGSAPRAFVFGNNAGANFSAGAGSSDHLVIKAINVAENNASSKWTLLSNGNIAKEWVPTTDILPNNSRVIVISPGGTTGNNRLLVTRTGGVFYTTYNNVAGADNLANGTDFDSSDETRVVYGVHNATDLRMPFNRADYFIERPATGISSTCAQNIGVLYKATVNHSSAAAGEYNKVPILDCVADMQVVFALDNNGNGAFVAGEGSSPCTDAYSSDLLDCSAGTPLTAAQIRTRVKEVRVYILAQEGQMDRTYTYPLPTIAIPAAPDPAAGSGRTFDLTNIANWRNYRWKIYTLIIKPNNLE